jgi:group I intron endonuclease
VTTRFTFYCHTNRVNGKQYVGQTAWTMEERWKSHVTSAKLHQGCRVFGAAIRKYGPDAFDHEILEVVVCTQQEADLIETEWIKRKGSRVPFGYNLTAGGGSHGLLHEDSKRLIGEASRKRLAGMTPEQRTEFFKKNIHIYTPERLARHAERFRSKEHREKVTADQKYFWSKLSPEERLARAKHMHAGISEEKKHERTRKAWAKLTPEKRAERIRNASEANVRAWSPERSKKRSEAQSARHAAIPPEQRREVVNKAWVTRRAKYGQSGMKNPAPARSGYVKLTPEELSKRRRKSWANMTPEAYDERVRKTREGKRLARLAKSGQQLDAELVPFVRHWHKRGHSIRSIALAFDVSTNEIERAVA